MLRFSEVNPVVYDPNQSDVTLELQEHKKRFPDGGVIEDLSRIELYETVADAVQAMDDGGDV